jgi:CRISPR system Cascade subunit CasA
MFMNLIGDPWLPVIFFDDTQELISLQALFEDGDRIRDLALTPPQRVAVMRFLICVAQRSLDGPKDESDWLSCNHNIALSCLDYLAKNVDFFDLTGIKPFMQVPNLESDKPALLDKLDFRLASGNNATVFDQAASPTGRVHPHAWGILNLLTFLNFSPGGLISQAKWDQKTTDRTSFAAPCIQAAHTFINSSNILQTLWLNLLTREDVTKSGHKWGQPTWELFPSSLEDKQAAINATQTYLGRLVPLTRLIKLQQGEEGYLAANVFLGASPKSWSFEHLPAYREPSTTVVIVKRNNKEEHAYMRLSLDKHIWRDLGAVLSVAQSVTSVGGPKAISRLQQRPDILSDEMISVWVGGLVARQASLEDTVEWRLQIPVYALNSQALLHYQSGVSLANDAEGKIRWAIETYLAEFKAYTGTDKRSRSQRDSICNKAATFYWQRLDQRYEVLLNNPTDLSAWRTIVRNAMYDAYSKSCPHNTARQIQAFVAGHHRLRMKTDTHIAPQEEQVA